MALDSHAKEVESWVLSRLREPPLGSPTELDAELSVRFKLLDIQSRRALVTRAIDSFLSEARTKRNRHVLKWLIEVVDDINLCICVGSETLLQRAMRGSGKPDAGVIKALLKAGHSLTDAAPGGVSPKMALELLYGRPMYDKVSLLFKIYQ
jgi:hypothetical protein